MDLIDDLIKLDHLLRPLGYMSDSTHTLSSFQY
jgi:hypothetical protein